MLSGGLPTTQPTPARVGHSVAGCVFAGEQLLVLTCLGELLKCHIDEELRMERFCWEVYGLITPSFTHLPAAAQAPASAAMAYVANRLYLALDNCVILYTPEGASTLYKCGSAGQSTLSVIAPAPKGRFALLATVPQTISVFSEKDTSGWAYDGLT